MTRLSRNLWLVALAIGALCRCAHAATLPTGFCVMQAVHNQNVSDTVLRDSRLAGFHVRDSWNLLEPKKGSFNFTFYDAQLARAARLGKHVTLGLYAGVQSDPSWGNAPDEFVKAVAALGARYNANPLIDAVHMAAPQVTDGSMEMYLPPSWHGTDQQAIAIWQRSIDAYAAAFPDKTLVLDLAMAPDSRGTITKAVDEYARAKLGDRFEATIDNLKATTSTSAAHIRELERLRAEGVRIGFEMVGPSSDTSRFGGTFAQAIRLGNQLGGQWYQIYQADVVNLPRLSVQLTPEPQGFGELGVAGAILVCAWRRRK